MTNCSELSNINKINTCYLNYKKKKNKLLYTFFLFIFLLICALIIGLLYYYGIFNKKNSNITVLPKTNINTNKVTSIPATSIAPTTASSSSVFPSEEPTTRNNNSNDDPIVPIIAIVFTFIFAALFCAALYFFVVKLTTSENLNEDNNFLNDIKLAKNKSSLEKIYDKLSSVNEKITNNNLKLEKSLESNSFDDTEKLIKQQYNNVLIQMKLRSKTKELLKTEQKLLNWHNELIQMNEELTNRYKDDEHRQILLKQEQNNKLIQNTNLNLKTSQKTIDGLKTITKSRNSGIKTLIMKTIALTSMLVTGAYNTIEFSNQYPHNFPGVVKQIQNDPKVVEQIQTDPELEKRLQNLFKTENYKEIMKIYEKADLNSPSNKNAKQIYEEIKDLYTKQQTAKKQQSYNSYFATVPNFLSSIQISNDVSNPPQNVQTSQQHSKSWSEALIEWKGV